MFGDYWQNFGLPVFDPTGEGGQAPMMEGDLAGPKMSVPAPSGGAAAPAAGMAAPGQGGPQTALSLPQSPLAAQPFQPPAPQGPADPAPAAGVSSPFRGPQYG